MLSSSVKANQILGLLRKRAENKRLLLCLSIYPSFLHVLNMSAVLICQKEYGSYKRTGKESKKSSDQRCDTSSIGD